MFWRYNCSRAVLLFTMTDVSLLYPRFRYFNLVRGLASNEVRLLLYKSSFVNWVKYCTPVMSEMPFLSKISSVRALSCAVVMVPLGYSLSR